MAVNVKSSRRRVHPTERGQRDREKHEREEREAREQRVRTACLENPRRLDQAAEMMRAVRSGIPMAYVPTSPSSVPSNVRAFVGLDPRNVPPPQRRSEPQPLPPVGDPESYAMARIDQIAIRDGVSRTQATYTFSKEEPEAALRARQAVLAKSHPAATSLTSANGQAAVAAFDHAVEAHVRLNGGTFAEAMIAVAAKNPDRARARTVALSLPIGPGGVVAV